MTGWLKQIYFRLTQALINHKADVQYIFLILLTALAFFWKVLLFPGQLITGQDTVDFFYPLYNYAYAVIHDGGFPYWNSLVLSGYPLSANPQFSLFYPLNSLFLFLPTSTAFGISYLLHVFLGGVFMYLLSKHLGLDRACAFLSAIVFMFGAFITSHIYAGHYTLICAAIWLPLLFLLFDLALVKKSLVYGLGAGAVLGIQLLAGHIQITYLSLIAIFLYLAYKLFSTIKARDFRNVPKPVIILAVMLVVGILLSAVQLFPSYEYSTYSTRVGGLSYADATVYSLGPGLLALSFSNPWSGPSWVSGDMPSFGFWEFSLYNGILTLILAVFTIFFSGKNSHVRFFVLLAVASLLLALGKYFPPYWLLYKLVPGFDIFRAPARFIVLFSFASAILAGFGLAFLRAKLSQVQTKAISKILVELALLAILIIVVAIFTTSKFSAIWIAMIALAILIIGSIVVIYLRIKERLSGRYFNIVAISFILTNLWFFHMPFVNVLPTTDIYPTPSYVSYLQEHSQGYRVYDPEGIMPHNHLMTLGISEITGYDATALNYYSEFVGDNIGFIGPNAFVFLAPYVISNLGENKLSLLNVKYVLSSRLMSKSDFKLVYSDSDVYIYEYIEAFPKAYVVHNAEVIPSGADVLTRLTDASFDIRKDIILQENPRGVSLLNEGNLDEATMEQYSPQKIEIRTSNATPGFLMLSETWYPSWKVYVDGRPGEIYKTDYALMSVFVGPGNHTVQFVYEDQAFKVGIVVSCATALFIIVIFGIHGIKARRSRAIK